MGTWSTPYNTVKPIPDATAPMSTPKAKVPGDLVFVIEDDEIVLCNEMLAAGRRSFLCTLLAVTLARDQSEHLIILIIF
jgi:hypothetical protein